MLLLTSTSDIIRIVTGSAADVDVYAAWIDHASGTFTPDIQLTGAINTATTTTIVSAPGASTQRNIKNIHIHNTSGSTATTVTVQMFNGTTSVDLINCNLLPDEHLNFDEGGMWHHRDATLGEYPAIGNRATQAEMEAGTSSDLYVTPQSMNWHPGVAKAWLKAGTTGNILASWNITSLTDTGTGVLTITIATDFSSVNYCAQVSVEATATTWAVANTRECHIRSATMAIGSIAVDCIDNTATTSLVKDPTSWHVSMFGDQT